MSQKVNLYDSAYGNYGSETYRQVRLETYGQDFGQTSWVTTEESEEIPQLLDLSPRSSVLEVGCGSGGYALYLAERAGCSLIGLDINSAGVRNANDLAIANGLASRVSFQQVDVSKTLPFPDGAFDAVFSNDVLCSHSRTVISVGGDVTRFKARRTNTIQRCPGNWRNGVARRDRNAQLDRLLHSTIPRERMNGS